MTERFPEQRNRSAQRRADASQVPDDALPPFDESFVAAAPVREPSAQARALSARRLLELPDSDPRRGPQPAQYAETRWSVRPSHHLAAIRPAAAAIAVGLAAIAALLFILLR
jgi:hypothetical protein